MHGYGIAEHIRQVSAEVLKVEEGSLYPALQRLQLQGLIASQWGQSANNRRARYYRLTPAGRRALGETESSFSRLIEAIGRVMKPALTPMDSLGKAIRRFAARFRRDQPR